MPSPARPVVPSVARIHETDRTVPSVRYSPAPMNRLLAATGPILLVIILVFVSGPTARAQSRRAATPARSLHRPIASQGNDAVFDERLAPFYHGVASGDPLPDGVIIWTRVTPPEDGPVDVQWRVATDTLLENVVASGTTSTSQDSDYTVKVDVRGLQPSTTYYYGFTALGRHSLTGRTKTAPSGPVDRLRFAVASCANYQSGYYNNYADIAARNDLDGVIFLGDYIYEYAEKPSGNRAIEARGLEPDGETVTLEEYRTRYAFYKLDPDLRRLNQQLPFIAVWDDHESANNSWRGGAENHDPDTEGDWEVRKHAAERAWFEWMPIRAVEPADTIIHRALQFGDLCDLIMLDTRLEGRDKQLDSLTGPNINDPNRTILGAPQYDWLTSELSNNTATWKVIGNQVMFSHLVAPPQLAEQGLELTDTWDGYPVERDRLLTYFGQHDLRNIVLLTGDIHTAWAWDVPLDGTSYNSKTGQGSECVEFVTPSITSDNVDEALGVPADDPQITTGAAVLRSLNPPLKYLNLVDHGYYVLDVTPAQVQADWYFADTILIRQRGEHYGDGWLVRAGTNHIVHADGPTQPRANPPAPAPLDPPAAPSRVDAPASSLLVIGIYPNPASRRTVINYVLNHTDAVRIDVVDIDGRRVATVLDSKAQDAGVHSVVFDASELASGTYFYSITSGGHTLTRRLTVRR